MITLQYCQIKRRGLVNKKLLIAVSALNGRSSQNFIKPLMMIFVGFAPMVLYTTKKLAASSLTANFF